PRILSTQTYPSEQHAGFEMYYEPAVTGWLYRGADAAPSHLSYRSAFLARKAVDELAAPPRESRLLAPLKAEGYPLRALVARSGGLSLCPTQRRLDSRLRVRSAWRKR